MSGPTENEYQGIPCDHLKTNYIRMKSESDEYQQKDELGKKGEEIAREHLIFKGYRILDVNWRHGHKEIDVVARQGEEIIVVEVKTRLENYTVEPWEAVTTSKIRNIVEVADAWLRIHQIDLETRFDVISVVIKKDGGHLLEHFEGAFIPPVN
jgi:putative endonuclease